MWGSSAAFSVQGTEPPKCGVESHSTVEAKDRLLDNGAISCLLHAPVLVLAFCLCQQHLHASGPYSASLQCSDIWSWLAGASGAHLHRVCLNGGSCCKDLEEQRYTNLESNLVVLVRLNLELGEDVVLRACSYNQAMRRSHPDPAWHLRPKESSAFRCAL